ncbi:hypothetical protein PanWU01x14_080680 [Parasponia andersonii]|uniref:Uncharacterized protein n=1 Tax=Parasponia andersonii TaxID=3476 RepID=A0A2P5DAT6_PARAD|nr:hypothetical protein PanWU01x14_080680 [Parasponia andersonii]
MLSTRQKCRAKNRTNFSSIIYRDVVDNNVMHALQENWLSLNIFIGETRRRKSVGKGNLPTKHPETSANEHFTDVKTSCAKACR